MRPDDSSLSTAQLRRVQRHAQEALQRASALGRFPTPIDEILQAASIGVVADNLFDHAFLARMRNGAGASLKSAIGKVIGLADTKAELLFIDHRLPPPKHPFLKLHEMGHLFLPWQRRMYALAEDCEGTLDPDLADEFERQANVFASEVLFQGELFAAEAADLPFGLRVPLDMAKRYGASVYSSIRRYVSTHAQPCVVLVVDMPSAAPVLGVPSLRRVVTSADFAARFATVTWPERFTSCTPLSDLLPSGGKRMRRPRHVSLTDDNGTRYEALGEAFVSRQQGFILIHVGRAVGTSVAWPGDRRFDAWP